MVIDSSASSGDFLPLSVSYVDHARHIANRGPSDHVTVATCSLARAVRRGRSELTMAAIGEVSLFLGFWGSNKEHGRLCTTIKAP